MLVDINLLPKKERDRPAFVIAAIGLMLLALVIWAVLFFMSGSQQAQQTELLAEASEVSLQQALIREQLDERIGLNEEQQLQKTVDWAESYEYDTIPLLNDLVSKLPQRGFFDSFNYTGPNEAVLVLQFDTSREAAYYLTQLKRSELLASASLVRVTAEELDAETLDQPVAAEEPAFVGAPRYFAEYQLVFMDDRIPAEGEAEIGELPLEEVPTDEGDLVEVEVEVTEDQSPEETEGDGQ